MLLPVLSLPVTYPAEMLNGANSVSSFGFSMAQNFSAYLTLVFVVLLPRVQLRYKVEQLMSFLAPALPDTKSAALPACQM